MKNKKNIILIGMPGVGKSTVGVILAKVTGRRFIDADLLIQEREGKRLKDIIREKGTDGFIEVENQVNASIEAKRAVIATGGSVIYGKEAMRHLKEIGTVVYLKVSFGIINRRLRNIKGRGVVLKKGQNLYELYEERCRLYEKYADVVVSTDRLNVEQTIEKVRRALRNAGETSSRSGNFGKRRG
ncbi:MAG: shikimate kinase [Eubacterium sp.]|nr:shikimate kinase [Eubacterium sp.]